MSFIAENDSWNYGDTISNNITLTQWNRTYHPINALNNNITITLPPTPDPSNSVESGLLCFVRSDFSMTNTVTIVANIGGFPTNIPIYPNSNAVHRFRTMYDPLGLSPNTTLYDVQLQDIGSASDRVQRDSVDTAAFTNLDINLSNYIGLVVSGWTLAAGSSLLLTNQNNTYQNGVYKVTPLGYIVHRETEPLGSDGKYHTFPVMRGDAAGYVFRITNAQNVEAPAIYGGSRLSISLYTVPPTSNLPSLGSAGQVLTVNGSGSGLQYSTIANTSVTGSVLALRASTAQNIGNSAITSVIFNTADTELEMRPSNVGITVTGNKTFTNNTGSAMTITVSLQVQWPFNSGGPRYVWIQRISTSNRVGMVATAPVNGGAVQSTSATFSLASGDGFIITVYQNSGSTLTLNDGDVGLGVGYAGRIQITRII